MWDNIEAVEEEFEESERGGAGVFDDREGRMIESVFGVISGLFDRKIDTVSAKVFIMKVVLFVVAYTIASFQVPIWVCYNLRSS